MKHTDLKFSEAMARQAWSDKLSLVERLKNLDDTFGVGKGAKKERAKLSVKAANLAKTAAKK